MNFYTPVKNSRFLKLALVVLVGLIVALVAIFVFKVKPSLVLNYGLIVAMIVSHFFMHSGHANNDGQHNQTTQVSPSSQLSMVPIENDDSQDRNHGCH
jgi:fatty acid desaturase